MPKKLRTSKAAPSLRDSLFVGHAGQDVEGDAVGVNRIVEILETKAGVSESSDCHRRVVKISGRNLGPRWAA
jgi:hypothetical protein